MKISFALTCVIFALQPLCTAVGQQTESQETIVKGIADYVSAKAEEAAKHNVYVHLKKGEFAHVLYDTKTKNHIPITVFQNEDLSEIKFCCRSAPDKVLTEGMPYLFRINKMDCYAIYKNKKVFVLSLIHI